MPIRGHYSAPIDTASSFSAAMMRVDDGANWVRHVIIAKRIDLAAIRPTGSLSLTATRLRLAEPPLPRQTSGHKHLPLGQCGRAAGLVGLAVDQVAFEVEVVVDVGMD